MICPKCGSDNVNVQAISETHLTKKSGCLYWMTIGWWWEPIMWLFLTLPMLFYKLFRPKKYKTRVVNKSMCVCQNCGKMWDSSK